MKCIPVNSEGEGRHRHARTKMAMKGRKKQTTSEKEANQNAHQEEGAEVESSKRKVIRVESQETKDYERESLNLSRDEAEEFTFVRSAISIPRGPMCRCDNRCSAKALRFWQFASLVSRMVRSITRPICVRLCNHERSTARGLTPVKNWQWKAVVEKKDHHGRQWRMLGKGQIVYKQ